MRRKEIEKPQNACPKHREKAKPNTFLKASSILEPPFKNLPALSLASLDNEEKRAIKAHQLEHERKRSEATRIVQQRVL